MVPRKILVIEDSDLIHKMYELVLRQYRTAGAALLHARNGLEGLTMLGTEPGVDLILLDINMPVMSGLEFLAQMRQHHAFSDIPVIIVSTEGKEEDTIRGLQAGARGYLKKPFRESELRALIDKLPAPPAAAGAEG